MSTLPRLQHAALLGFALAAGLAVGCKDEVYSRYGVRSGHFQTSLNGTRVLSDMFGDAGHLVRSKTYLSPSLYNADVIVWFPDDFEAPTFEVGWWLTEWLEAGDPNGPPKVLIYVGRDFDAAPDYWQRMQAAPPQGLKAEYARRLTEAKVDAARNRPATLSNPATDDWFTLDNTPPVASVKNLGGPWAADVDGMKAEIERNARLVPLRRRVKTLLADEKGDAIVSEQGYDDYYGNPAGRLIMIENGSWLLNARMVNHEHRKLAGRLVDTIGPPRRRVVFLESGDGGPTIHETDPSATPPTGLELFRVWPIGAVLTQLAALGIVFALMKWPIFGTPRLLKRASITDFGSHITALGRLLRYGRNRTHAAELLRVYRQSLRRDQAPTIETTPPTGGVPELTDNTPPTA